MTDDELRAQFDRMDQRFDAQDRKIDNLSTLQEEILL